MPKERKTPTFNGSIEAAFWGKIFVAHVGRGKTNTTAELEADTALAIFKKRRRTHHQPEGA